jgi:hypothetical protein
MQNPARAWVNLEEIHINSDIVQDDTTVNTGGFTVSLGELL